jgi:hypothetical protein
MYAEIHQRNDKFGGDSLGKHIPEIEALVRATGSRTVLDYGCGRARHYKEQNLSSRWGGVRLYDPAVKEFRDKPEGKFDGVICTDVLEHVLEPDVVLEEIFGYAEKFVFLAISCLPSTSSKTLRDGTPFHISIHPPSWWRERIPETEARVELRFDVDG